MSAPYACSCGVWHSLEAFNAHTCPDQCTATLSGHCCTLDAGHLGDHHDETTGERWHAVQWMGAWHQ